MSKPLMFLKRVQHFFLRHVFRRKILTAFSEKYNTYFRFYSSDSLGCDIYYRWGVYSEDHINEVLKQKISFSNDDLVLDIGANIGWYSLTLSSDSSPKIFAFEPDIFNFSLLKENIALNHKQNIVPVNMAAGAQKGELELFLYKNYNRGRHSMIQHKKATRSVKVPVTTMDHFLAEQQLQTQPIRFIKIDIEGFEWEALKGAQQALSRTEWLLTEFTPSLMVQLGQNPHAFIQWLQSFGFTLMQVEKEGVFTPDFNAIISSQQQVNLLCHKIL